MKSVLFLHERITKFFAIISGWALIAIAVATVIEILGRKFFNFSFRGVDEIGAYVLAAVSAIGFSFALSRNEHMRVTLLFGLMSQRVRAVVNLAAMLSLAGIAVFCLLRGGVEIFSVFESGKRSATPLQVPLWIPGSIWLLGIALFAIGAVIMAMRASGLFVREQAQLNTEYGPGSEEFDQADMARNSKGRNND